MALQTQERTLAARSRALGEMARHYEGYAKGVKTAMAAARQGTLRGVIGPVGEQFHVAAPYTVALETALGGAMQNLLVEDEAAGKAVLRLVKQRDGGRVTCLPLTALRPAQLREEGLEARTPATWRWPPTWWTAIPASAPRPRPCWAGRWWWTTWTTAWPWPGPGGTASPWSPWRGRSSAPGAP